MCIIRPEGAIVAFGVSVMSVGRLPSEGLRPVSFFFAIVFRYWVLHWNRFTAGFSHSSSGSYC